jgi:TRAP transporter TAXI family solute receptor
VKKAAVAAFAALFIASTGLAQAQPVGIGTSPQGTLVYALGATVAKVLTEKGGIQARVQPQSGTGSMIPLVDSGEIDIGFANTLELYDAFKGVGTFPNRPNPKLRAIAVIFPIQVGLFVRADSGIRTVKDLKGKTSAYGFTSQEVIRKTIDAMLAAEGLSITDLKTVLVPNLVRGVDELMAGRVDVTTFAVGSAKVAEADASVGGIRWLPIPDGPNALAQLRREFPTAYFDRVQPAPNLAGVKEPFVTMAYDYTVFANADVPAERIKTITRLIAENKDLLAGGHPLFKGMQVERLYTSIDVPYHPGAIAYYNEKGIKEVK